MKLFYTITIFFISFYSFLTAQSAASTVKYDERLLELYDQSYLENLTEKQPFIIQRWNFMLDNSYEIVDFPTEKMSDDYRVIHINDLENLNILKLIQDLNLTKDQKKNTFYRIGDSNKHLLLFPREKMAKRLNQHLNRDYKKT